MQDRVDPGSPASECTIYAWTLSERPSLRSLCSVAVRKFTMHWDCSGDGACILPVLKSKFGALTLLQNPAIGKDLHIYWAHIL